jgi:hypothetical protein
MTKPVAIVVLIAIPVAFVLLLGAQSVTSMPAPSLPKMTDQAFKNIQVLRGIPA